MPRGHVPLPALAIGAAVVLRLLPTPAKRSFAEAVGPILFYPAARAVAFVDGIQALRAENATLRFQLATRVVDRAQTEALREENERLRLMVGMRERTPSRLIAGRVIAYPGRWEGEYLALDVGTTSGVEVGSCVLAVEGLAGKVVEVRPTTSLVRTLLSPETRVSVVVARTGAGGILRMERTKGLVVPDVPLVDEVAVGDTVVTSGLGGVFPPHLPVGVVSSVSDDLRMQLHRLEVHPFVRFPRVREVFVMVPTAPDTSWSADERVLR